MTDKDGGLLGLGANLIGDTLGMGGTTRDPAEPGRYMGDIPDYIMREVVNQRKSAMANIHKSAQILPPPPLTKPPGHYLTGYEGSKCKQVRPDIWNRLKDFKWREEREKKLQEAQTPMQGIDTDKFRKECLEEDE